MKKSPEANSVAKVKSAVNQKTDSSNASGACLRLGEFLLQNGLINNEQLDQALEMQKQTGRKLGAILVDMGLLTEERLCEELSDRLGIPYFDLENYIIDPKVVQMVPEHLCERFRLIGIRKSGKKLTVAMVNTFDEMALEDMRILTGLEIKPVLATPSAISKALTTAFGTIDYAASLLEVMSTASGRVDIKDSLYRMLEAADKAKAEQKAKEGNKDSESAPDGIVNEDTVIEEGIEGGKGDERD